MPLRSRIPGEPYAPAVSTTASASMSPADVAAPVARSPCEQHAVDERVAEDRQVRARARLVEVGERRVPPHGADRVHRVDDRVGCGLGEGRVPRRQLVAFELARAELRPRAVEVRPDRLVAPAVAPLVVVGRRALEHDARVVRRAAAEDARAELRAVLAVGLPRVREREPARVEDVVGPAAVGVRGRSRGRPRRGTPCARDPRSGATPSRNRRCRRRARARRSASGHSIPWGRGRARRLRPATRAWFERAFDAPTPAQVLGWPAIASGEHTLIQAPTGSGQDARRVPLRDRPADRGGRRQGTAAPVRLAAQGAQLRHRAQPARAARGPRVGPARRRPHGRHDAARALADAPRAPGHPDHDAGVAVPAAHVARARDAARGPDDHRRRGARGRGDEARRAPGAEPRAARPAHGRADPADRALGDAAAARGDRTLRLGRPADPARRRRCLEAARPAGRRAGGGHARAGRGSRPRGPARRQRRGTRHVDLAVDLPGDPAPRPRAPLDDRLREQPPSRGAARAAAQRARRGRDCARAPRLDRARAARRDRGAAEARRDPVPRRDVVARARHRHGRRRPRDPGRVAEVGRARAAADRACRPLARRGVARAHLPEVPRRPARGGGDRPADAGGRDRGDGHPAQPTRRARAANRRDLRRGRDRRRRAARARARRLPVRRPSAYAARQRARHARRPVSVRRVRRAAAAHHLGPHRRRDSRPAGLGAARGDERGHDPRPRPLRRPSRRRRRPRRRARRGDGLRGARRADVPARRVDLAHRGDHARPRPRLARAGRARSGAVLEGRGRGAALRARPRDRRVLAQNGELALYRHSPSGLSIPGLDERSAQNLLQFLHDQQAATGAVPSDKTVVVERFRDEIGDWRVCILTPFGARVHAPWALAAAARLRESLGIEVQSIWSDDGIAFHLPDADAPPATDDLLLGAGRGRGSRRPGGRPERALRRALPRERRARAADPEAPAGRAHAALAAAAQGAVAAPGRAAVPGVPDRARDVPRVPARRLRPPVAEAAAPGTANARARPRRRRDGDRVAVRLEPALRLHRDLHVRGRHAAGRAARAGALARPRPAARAPRAGGAARPARSRTRSPRSSVRSGPSRATRTSCTTCSGSAATSGPASSTRRTLPCSRPSGARSARGSATTSA